MKRLAHLAARFLVLEQLRLLRPCLETQMCHLLGRWLDYKPPLVSRCRHRAVISNLERSLRVGAFCVLFGHARTNRDRIHGTHQLLQPAKEVVAVAKVEHESAPLSRARIVEELAPDLPLLVSPLLFEELLVDNLRFLDDLSGDAWQARLEELCHDGVTVLAADLAEVRDDAALKPGVIRLLSKLLT